ncbi:MAG TPA: glycerophosphodiester phosphodiesterase [Streptosporangiaceae bacterium]|nr:glycerophosphodiester phosphodiesterase [Streptosporangiaceae bacterium]
MGRDEERPPRTSAPRISAHRGGGEAAPEGTYQAYRYALDAGADYLELDIRRTGDGTLVACHQDRLGHGRVVADMSYDRLCGAAGYEVPRLREVLDLLAGRAGAHLDLKEAGSAAAAVQQALGVLEPGSILATTRDRAVVRALKDRYPALPVALTVGGDLAQTAHLALMRARRPSLTWLRYIAAAHADRAAIHRRLAGTGLAAACRASGIGTVIWTVTGDRALASWLASPDADVVVTDRPARAVAMRDQRSAAGQ